MKSSLRIVSVGLSIAIAGLCYGCSDVTSPHNGVSGPNPPSSSTVKKVESANNSFSTSLFDQLAAQEQGKNFFISPFSVSMALAMTLNGAAGQTYSDMQRTLGLSGLSNEQINQAYQNLMTTFSSLDPSVKFDIANSIWYRNTFAVEDSFLDVDSTYFDARVIAVDFSSASAAEIINSWVSDKTDNKIQSIIQPPIDPSTVMFLINALYFNGTWKYTFDSKNTKPETFYLANGSTESDSMMVVHDTIDYYSDQSFTAVELPYGDGDYSMLILLPTNAASAVNTIGTLSQGEVNSIVAGLKPEDVQLTMPKFKVKYSTKLNGVLSQMGMGIAFSDGANFTRINPAGGLYISEVLHKTYIDVNEQGTEAAAVTVVTIGTTVVIGGHSGPIMVDVDRPFAFLIKENRDNTILFMGAVAQPSVEVTN
ncbi:MAG: serpin family protein [Bacteroidetes bacterium]|nr:serpin family protein [Bacteroidota bacterium]